MSQLVTLIRPLTAAIRNIRTEETAVKTFPVGTVLSCDGTFIDGYGGVNVHLWEGDVLINLPGPAYLEVVDAKTAKRTLKAWWYRELTEGPTSAPLRRRART